MGSIAVDCIFKMHKLLILLLLIRLKRKFIPSDHSRQVICCDKILVQYKFTIISTFNSVKARNGQNAKLSIGQQTAYVTYKLQHTLYICSSYATNYGTLDELVASLSCCRLNLCLSWQSG